MKEKNKDSLKKAIENLPVYKAEDQLWGKLSDKMRQEKSDLVLHDAIGGITEYQAPDHIWANIEAELPKKVKRAWLRPLAVAATLALLVSFVWYANVSSFEEEIVNVTHTEKSIEQKNFIVIDKANAASRDSAFRTIVKAQKKSNDRAKAILAEIELLEHSQKQLESKLSKYDSNNVLKDKLLKIKTEREQLQLSLIHI